MKDELGGITITRPLPPPPPKKEVAGAARQERGIDVLTNQEPKFHKAPENPPTMPTTTTFCPEGGADPMAHSMDAARYFNSMVNSPGYTSLKTGKTGGDGTLRVSSTGATRDTSANKPEYHRYFNPKTFARFGQYMLEHQVDPRGNYRPGNNWQMGMPREWFVGSLLRHYVEVWERFENDTLDGKDGEDALCAIIFNAQGLLLELLLGRDVEG